MLTDLYAFWFTIVCWCVGINLVAVLLTVIMCIISIALTVCFIEHIIDRIKRR